MLVDFVDWKRIGNIHLDNLMIRLGRITHQS